MHIFIYIYIYIYREREREREKERQLCVYERERECVYERESDTRPPAPPLTPCTLQPIPCTPNPKHPSMRVFDAFV